MIGRASLGNWCSSGVDTDQRPDAAGDRGGSGHLAIDTVAMAEPGARCLDAFRRGWTIPQCAMWPDGVGVDAPLLDEDLGLPEAVEDFAVQQFVPEPGVEAFAGAVLPGRSRFDMGGLGPDRRSPVPHVLSDKFRPIVGSYVVRRAARAEKVGQCVRLIG